MEWTQAYSGSISVGVNGAGVTSGMGTFTVTSIGMAPATVGLVIEMGGNGVRAMTLIRVGLAVVPGAAVDVGTATTAAIRAGVTIVEEP
jgi:hypothetical protein